MNLQPGTQSNTKTMLMVFDRPQRNLGTLQAATSSLQHRQADALRIGWVQPLQDALAH